MRTVDPVQPHAALLVVVLGATDGIGAELCRQRAAGRSPWHGLAAGAQNSSGNCLPSANHPPCPIVARFHHL
jgi:hypothetical protein